MRDLSAISHTNGVCVWGALYGNSCWGFTSLKLRQELCLLRSCPGPLESFLGAASWLGTSVGIGLRSLEAFTHLCNSPQSTALLHKERMPGEFTSSVLWRYSCTKAKKCKRPRVSPLPGLQGSSTLPLYSWHWALSR